MKTIKIKSDRCADITLPNMIFFKPTKEFIRWIVKFAGKKTVVDCGCGVGHLVNILDKSGISIYGIDLVKRDDPETSLIIHSDCSSSDFNASNLVIITRPNRGEWIRTTISNALSSGANVVYAGLQEHYEEDLDGYQTELIMEMAGEDGEKAWLIKGQSMKKKFSLIKWYDGKLGPFWFLDEGNKWRNNSGGFMPKSKDDKIIEAVEAEDFEDLDWKKTTLYKSQSDAGWLSPDGTWYPCDSTAHDNYAYYILKKDVEELEKETWVRVYGKDSWVQQNGRLSAEQRNWLSYNGHKVKDED